MMIDFVPAAQALAPAVNTTAGLKTDDHLSDLTSQCYQAESSETLSTSFPRTWPVSII
jgi:hypothetical protein